MQSARKGGRQLEDSFLHFSKAECTHGMHTNGGCKLQALTHLRTCARPATPPINTHLRPNYSRHTATMSKLVSYRITTPIHTQHAPVTSSDRF
jgi:hypothetical protein